MQEQTNQTSCLRRQADIVRRMVATMRTMETRFADTLYPSKARRGHGQGILAAGGGMARGIWAGADSAGEGHSRGQLRDCVHAQSASKCRQATPPARQQPGTKVASAGSTTFQIQRQNLSRRPAKTRVGCRGMRQYGERNSATMSKMQKFHP